MLTPYESYQYLCDILRTCEEKMRALDEQARASDDDVSKEAAHIEASDSSAFAELEDNIRVVKAFIGIASINTTVRKKATAPIEFNKRQLSFLQVQIKSGSSNDPFAARLYTEATGQLMYLEAKKSNRHISTEILLHKLKEENRQSHISVSKKKNEIILDSIRTFFSDKALARFAQELKTDKSKFAFPEPGAAGAASISLGVLKLPVPDIGQKIVYERILELFSSECFEAEKKTIAVPVSVSAMNGGVIYAEYSASCEKALLSGIHNFIFNLAKYQHDRIEKVYFIDSMRMSRSSLGALSVFTTGSDPFIDDAPLSQKEICERIERIIQVEKSEELGEKSNDGLKVYFFHNYPHGYSSESVALIRQLCANAEYYKAIVVLTSCVSKTNHKYDLPEHISLNATRIYCEDGKFLMEGPGRKKHEFSWYSEPAQIPQSIIDSIVVSKAVETVSNDYAKVVGKQPIAYKKGKRTLRDIPYGIDESGKLYFLDFDTTNFATFICGASRSGKSNLLHILVTGLIKNNHPDDIEMWLIDFGKSAFSQYMDNPPPHIRYILLDQSPELVFDILDRLTEILNYRVNAFMNGKWEKLSEVPKEEYMPAMVIIIDEFSIMSDVITENEACGKDNYKLKLKTLLSMGAKYGMNFIFSSQKFTAGTSALNAQSIDQIQQRIAMKTTDDEIRETLSVKYASDSDRRLMAHLEKYYALVKRVPPDAYGNYLVKTKVLYFSDKNDQQDLFDSISAGLCPKPDYDVDDVEGYIYKEPLIIDGNSYCVFTDVEEYISDFLYSNESEYSESGGTALFIGEPLKLKKVYPIDVYNNYSENLLLISPTTERSSCVSLLTSLCRSLRMQSIAKECWTAPNNRTYSQLVNSARVSFENEYSDLADICCRIKQLTQKIKDKKSETRFIFLFGFNSILNDMEYIDSTETPDESRSIVLERTMSGINNIMSQLENIEAGGDTYKESSGFDHFNDILGKSDREIKFDYDPDEVDMFNASEYNAIEDFKFILKRGARYGYHFIMVSESVCEFMTTKLDYSCFRHKVMFRIPKSEASEISSMSHGNEISTLADHIFRYTNGLDSVSFRPYLHKGISVDGWMVESGKAVRKTETKKIYLV